MAGNKVTLTFAGDTKGMEKATGDVDKSTKKMGSSFDKLAVVGAAAGAAAGAAIAAGIASGLESSKTSALLDAQLGASAESAGHWGALAGKVYAHGVAESMDDAAGALKAVWQNGLIDEDATDAQLERITSKVLNVATVLQEDSSKVGNAVAQMLKTGLVDTADEAFDLLVRGTQQGINKSEDLLDTFNEYGTQFRKLGLDGPAALGLLGQAIRAGARDSDVAADALKEFSIRAIDGSKATADGFKSLGLDAKKMAQQIAGGGPAAAAGLDSVLDKLRGVKDPVEQARIATELFGTQAEDLGAALFAFDPSEATKSLGDLGGAADKAGKALEDSAGAKLEKFKRQAQAALVDKLAEAVPYIEKTFGWLKDNSDWVVPLATGLGILAGVIGTIVLATKVWTAVQTAFNIVMALNPVALIVIGILLLIGVIVLIATKTTWFQDLWKLVWGGIKDAASAVWDWISGTLWPGIKAVWDGIVFGVVWVKDKFVEAWNGIKDYAGKVWDYFTGLPDKLKSIFDKVKDFITAPFKAAFNFVARAWNNTIGKLHWTVPGWVPGVGGNSISAPTLPEFHTGGIVSGALGSETLAVLQAGERVTPAGGGSSGGMAPIVIGSDGSRLGDLLVDVLAAAIGKRGGNVQRVLGGTRG